jgi:hypothetical protein
MSFQIKKFNSIVASMVNWVSSATDRITDFNTGSVVRTILEVVAIELEELYYQLLRAVEEAIEEAIYRTFNFPRNPSQKATGAVRFYRLAGTVPEITINRGTMVGTDTDPSIYFETQADDSIPALTGYATGGSNLELIDYSKNWVTEGVHIGSRVMNITDSGETQSAGVLLISSTAPGTDNTLNFSALTNGASFSLPAIGDYPLGCRFDKVYYYDGSLSSNTDYTTNSGRITPGTGCTLEILTITGGPPGSILTLNPTPTVAGTGYAVGDVLAITTGGIGGKATVLTITGGLGTGPVGTVSLTAVGSGYTTGAGKATSGYISIGLVGGEDYIYLGHSDPFFGFQSAIGAGTPQAVTADMVVEFWNGSSWASADNLVDGTTLPSPAPSKPFSITGVAYWDYPASWAKVAYNGFYYYWVRISSVTTLTAGAQIDRLQYRKGNEYKVIVLYEDVAVQAVVSGAGGNVAGGAIDVLISNVSNINSITNPAAFNDGRDEETDSERKDRFALYIQSLARATKGALEYAARTVEQVIAAKAVDDIRPWVYVLDTPIYTDITSAMRNPGDAAVDLLPTAEASGDALYIGADEPFSWLNMHLVTAGTCIDPTKATWQYYNGTTFTPIVTGLIDGTDSGTGTLTQSGTISFTIPTDWVASTLVVSPTVSKLKMWIRLGITGNAYSAIPTGDWCSLPPGFGYVYLYIHDGSGDANATLITAVENAVELYRGCGIIVEVKAPVKIQPAIAVTLLVASNYDPNDVADDVEQGIVDWMNTFVLGQDFYLAELYQQVMDRNDKAIINATATINGSDNDIIVPSASVIRPDPLTVVVTGISI